MTKKEQAAKDRANAAAENGDVKGYKDASAEAFELGTELVVARAQLKKITESTTLSEEEATATWKEYAKEYERTFERL